MRDLCIELWKFFVANLRATYFGVFLLSLFVLSEIIVLPGISRYDFIFLCAVGYQTIALLIGSEQIKEFAVIILFHILATIMELFKTSPSIGSWSYPEVATSFFVISTVPLFTGFLYSAVGSYISRAFVFLNLSYKNFPSYVHVCLLASLIYINFFTHHFIYDLRYLLFGYVVLLFYKTKVYFKVHQKERVMPFLLTAFLSALFIWIAENIGTFTGIWLYPNQMKEWHFVSLEKIGSWLLLLILSFGLVSIIYRQKIKR